MLLQRYRDTYIINNDNHIQRKQQEEGNDK
jgi:hypothetical protein